MSEHSHTPDEAGAAPEGHGHGLDDLFIDVAEKSHSHTAHDLPQTPTLQQYERLAERVADLELQFAALQERFEAEAQVGAAVAAGASTPELIAAAIERRCDAMRGFDGNTFLITQLRELAREIREAGA